MRIDYLISMSCIAEKASNINNISINNIIEIAVDVIGVIDIVDIGVFSVMIKAKYPRYETKQAFYYL